MDYIFIVGTPGSRWSSVSKNIYWSPNINHSDYSDARTYSHSATGRAELLHIGAYFDPGMEFGSFFDRVDQHTREEFIAECNRPFTPIDGSLGLGIRIVKSHCLSNHIDWLKTNFPDCPVVLVYRDDEACLDWWKKCGAFDIKYPDYSYFVDLDTMEKHIKQQNANILKAWDQYPVWDPMGPPLECNLDLCQMLTIEPPAEIEYYQEYHKSDIKVKVI
jgi:hypothetical protein